MSNYTWAIQMYTVRDAMAADFAGTFEKVAKLGYGAVELAGLGGLTPVEVRKILDDNGLVACGSHIMLDALEADLPKVVEEQKVLGNPFVVVPWMPQERREDAAGWRNVAAIMSDAAAKLKEEGLGLAYHNHSFEFESFDGTPGLDIFFGTASADVLSELDLYWVQHGGQSPAGYIRKLAGRVPLIHLKDMAPGPDRAFAEVGYGILDWAAIRDAALASGVKWAIVEQDTCPGDPFVSIKKSIDWLNANA